MPPRPLGLDDEQLELVMTAANTVAIMWRNRFLAAVADQLTRDQLRTGQVTTDNVRQAISTVLAHFSGGEAA